MIQTKGLSFNNLITYEDIHIEELAITFITGESGCGKSTLLKLFNRSQNFTTGEILYKGIPLTQLSVEFLRSKIKLISQTPFLFSGSIKENFEKYYSYCNNSDLNLEKISYFLNLTEAKMPIDSNCDTLSGGEKQRVYLAICLSLGGETFLLDEPTSSLDYDLSVKVMNNLVSHAKDNKKTLVFVSHDQKLTKQFGEKIITLTGGAK